MIIGKNFRGNFARLRGELRYLYKTFTMYKKVIAFGCSFTDRSWAGENKAREQYLPKFKHLYQKDANPDEWELSRKQRKRAIARRDLAYPQLLGNLLSADVLNISKPGRSNDGIFRRAQEWINNDFKSEEKTVILIGLTHPMREEVYLPHNSAYECIQYNDFTFQGANLFYKNNKESSAQWWLDNWRITGLISEAEFFTYWSIRCEHFWDYEQDVLKINRQMQLLELLCQSKDIDVVFISCLVDKLTEIKGLLFRETHLPKLDSSSLLYFPKGDHSWRQYIESYDNNYRYEHPNSYDHEVLANLIYAHLKNK